eukprot:TRINITY_DN10267_c0_g1_i1.p1 TRINITY_DN10267_c0_g1~~TRINITY_DN10267_c0_g1_i1.p1  ORF type:complete len:286 (+),score=66.53 TRINITY_DN10267_c0_g1_i1:278-1135(+)
MQDQEERLPANCIRFRPNRGGKHRNVLLVATAAGELGHWCLATRERLSTVRGDPEKELYATDCREDGLEFATAGREHIVRVYDEETGQEKMQMKWGASKWLPEPEPAHVNRIQAVRYCPGDPHCLLSAGWDETVQFWDTRTDQATGYWHGPYVLGDALDIHPDGRTVVTGSCRDADQLQVWDLAMKEAPCETIPVPQRDGGHNHVYAVQFRPQHGHEVAVGGTTGTVVCDVKTKRFAPGRCVPCDFHSVFTVAWNDDGMLLASAGAAGRVVQAQAVPPVESPGSH